MHFFAIKSAPAIQHVVQNFVQCNSVKKIPHELGTQSVTPLASKPSAVFYADVLRPACQHILVIRDVHSYYSIATIVPKETSDRRYSKGILYNNCLKKCDYDAQPRIWGRKAFLFYLLKTAK